MKGIIRAICLILMPTLAWGQPGFGARSMGMAGAYQGMARGAEVCFWNPANLALPDGPRLSLDLLGAGLSMGNNSFSIGLYNDYFSQDYFDGNGGWDDAAKNYIISQVPSGGFSWYNRFQLTYASVSYLQYALAVNGFAHSTVQLPQELIEIPLRGLGTDPVEMTDFEGEAVWGTEIAMSGATVIDPGWVWADYLTIGGTFKFLIGHAYAELAEAEGAILSNTDSIGVNGHYRLLLAAPFDGKGRSGYGVGFDVGAAARISATWDVGLSLHNVIGSIRFGHLEESQGSFAFNQPGLNIDEFDNFKEYIDSVSIETDTTFDSDEKVSYELPKSLLLSATYRISPKVTLEADYHQGLNNTAGGTTTPRLAVGGEWRHWPWLPTRFGFGLGGIQGTTLACGLGLVLSSYQLDLAVASQRGLFYGSKGFNFAISHRIIF